MVRLKAHPGFWTLTFLVVANMVGAGVFTTSGFSLADLGSPERVLWAWFVAGVIALAGAFSYGQLVKAMPESGGEYLFLSRAAHPLLGFIAGWVSLIAGFSGAIAFAATTLEEYAVPVRPDWLPRGLVAVLSIAIAGAFHGLRPRVGAILQNTIVLLKLILLVGIFVYAAPRIFDLNMVATEDMSTKPIGFAAVTAFANSLVWISLSYSGFNAAVYIAGEVDDMKRVVPRSLLVATLAVTILYMLLNMVFVYSAPAAAIMGQPDVAAIAARSLGGPWFEAFVRWTIVACLLTSVFSMMMAAPRVYAKMADDGLMPKALRFDRGQTEGPRMATLLQVGLAAVLVLATTLQGLLSYLGLTLSLCAACSVACLFLPSIRDGRSWRLTDLIPSFYLLGTLVSALVLTASNPWQLMGTVVTFSVGAAVYWLISRRSV